MSSQSRDANVPVGADGGGGGLAPVSARLEIVQEIDRVEEIMTWGGVPVVVRHTL